MIKVELSEVLCECGGKIQKSNKPYIHQKIDIPEIKPHVINYLLEHGQCIKYRKRKSAQLPKGVSRDTFGDRINTIIAALSGFFNNSKRTIEEILNSKNNQIKEVGGIFM